MTEEHQHKALVTALCEILGQCNAHKFFVLHLNENMANVHNSSSLINGDNRVQCMNDEEITVSASPFNTMAIVDPTSFHDNIRIRTALNLSEVEKYYLENINVLKAQYGILLFLYSVIITKVKKFSLCFQCFFN